MKKSRVEFVGYDPDRIRDSDIARFIKQSAGGIKLSPYLKRFIKKLIKQKIKDETMQTL